MNRRNIMLSLIPVLVLLLIVAGLVGDIGTYELLLWLAFVAAWAVGYMAWGRPRRRKGH
jgi:hypothetical protein